MSKGGDTTTSETSGDLPEYIKPYVTDLLSRAKNVSGLPYVPYGNQRLANFSPDTTASFDMLRDVAGQGTPGIDAAMTTASGVAGYTPGSFSTTGIPDMDMSAYMDPYIQNVLDVQKGRATRAFGEQQAGRNHAAVQAGAFGGDRRFIQDMLATRDLNEQMQFMDAEGLSGAFDRATQMFTTDEDRRLRAAMATEDARRGGAELGLEGARTMSTLDQLRQDMGFRGAEALSGVGSKIQQREQAGLDLAYKDFVSQRDWPAQQLSLYSQLLSGTPVTPTSTTTVTQPAPDFLSQLIGLGVGAAGIWDMFQ